MYAPAVAKVHAGPLSAANIENGGVLLGSFAFSQTAPNRN